MNPSLLRIPTTVFSFYPLNRSKFKEKQRTGNFKTLGEFFELPRVLNTVGSKERQEFSRRGGKRRAGGGEEEEISRPRWSS